MIIITSRDFAIMFLYRCLRHSHTEHELRTIFHHLNSFKNDQNVSDCTFWEIFYKRKFSFLLIFCMRNPHSTVIESYIRRDDVIWCELDCLTIIEIESLLSSLLWDSLIDSHRSLSRNALVENVIIPFLERRKTERIYLWLMIWLNRQLSFN